MSLFAEAAVHPTFPDHDFARYLKTGEFERVYAMLATPEVAGLIDYRKNRLQQLFAHGRFGTLQNLTYHVLFTNNDSPLEGFYPYHSGGDGTVSYPLRRNIFKNDHAPRIRFDPGRSAVAFEGATLYRGGEHPVDGSCDWSVQAHASRFQFTASIAASPSPRETGIQGTIYPLYDRVFLDGTEKQIEYRPAAGVLGDDWIAARTVEFRDSKGRMPRLRIVAENGQVRYEAVTLESEIAGARSLIIRAGAPGSSVKVSIELLPNPAAVSVPPLMPTGRQTAVRVFTAGNEAPLLKLDGRPVALRRAGDGVWVSRISVQPGHHALVAELGDSVSERHVIGLPDFQAAVVTMADTLLRGQSDTEKRWPRLAGMFPQVMNRDFTPRRWGEFNGVVMYMPRVAMILSAATMITGDPKYVDGAMRGLRAYMERGRTLGEGVFLPACFTPEGDIPAAADGWPRPSNFAIMARGFLSCRQAYARLGRNIEGAEALEQAYRVAMGLYAARCPTGEWPSRISYTNPRCEGRIGFVNTPHYTFWRLSDLLAPVDKAKAANVRSLVGDCLKALRDLTSPQPIRSTAVRGDEDIPCHAESWSAVVSLSIASYLLDSHPWMAERARNAQHAGIWINNFYIDHPEKFAHPYPGPDLPKFFQGRYPAKSFGGMVDLVQLEASLMVANHLDDQFAADAAAYLFGSRLAWSLEKDGFLVGFDQSVPGFSFRQQKFTETLNYGGVGVYGLWCADRR